MYIQPISNQTFNANNKLNLEKLGKSNPFKDSHNYVYTDIELCLQNDKKIRTEKSKIHSFIKNHPKLNSIFAFLGL